MEIILQEDFLSITKNKHILLDNCVFLDAVSHQNEFRNFFNKLKENNTTLLTIPTVLNEFLRGSTTDEKFDYRKKYILNIVDAVLSTNDVQDNIEMLIKEYSIDSKDLSEADLSLGGMLVKYKKNIFLLTRDLADFPTSIFSRDSFFNISHTKGMFVYGLYSFNR